MARTFEEWWSSVPADLKQKARKGDEANKPLLNQINYVPAPSSFVGETRPQT